jgi:LysM repeat protein
MKKSLLLLVSLFLCGCSLFPRAAQPTPTPALSPPTPTPTATATPTPPPTPTLAPMVYVVQPGDTLASIATRFGTTAEAICTYNELPNCNLIYPGQELLISTPEVIPPTETPSPTT